MMRAASGQRGRIAQQLPLLFVVVSTLLLVVFACAPPRIAAGDSPDMTMATDDVAFSRLNVSAGENVVAYAHVRNIGNLAGNATVRFYREDGGVQLDVLLGESLITVASGGSAVASAEVSLPAGIHNLTASVDDVNPSDSNPSDNVATATIEIFPSPDLVNFSTPTLLMEPTRVTVQGGAERVIPLNVTVLGGKAIGVSLRALESSGVFAEPVNSPVDADSGQTIQLYLRISAPGLDQDSSPSERELLVQATGSNARGNVASVALLVHPPVSIVSWWNPATAALAAAGALSILLAGLHTVEPSRYKLLGLVLPLYSKLRKENVLDQYTRGRIHGYITANPGDYFASIGRGLGITGGNLAYHLRVLEREGQIVSARDGTRKRFYPKGAKVDLMNDCGLPAVQSVICRIVCETPGIRQKDIASQMGVTSSTVSYHLQKMAAQGVVRAQRKGMSVRYYFADEKRRADLLKRTETRHSG